MQTYPLGIALKAAGGRKTKENRHIRSARQRRKAFEIETERLMRQYEQEKDVCLDVSPERFWEMAARDTCLAALGAQLVDLRIKYLGRGA